MKPEEVPKTWLRATTSIEAEIERFAEFVGPHRNNSEMPAMLARFGDDLRSFASAMQEHDELWWYRTEPQLPLAWSQGLAIVRSGTVVAVKVIIRS